ncbi:MAG TPA: hypothetical protein P5548_00950 [Candidatus Moranbacteria bacterium]|nr:hypothetical protein [Candidatus Moranbacteria bacterium]HRZ33460.1 hypothetical protein [Candidatus Moranbacteria bacterium]
MRIINKTSFNLIAFGWHTKYGYGNDVEIKTGQFADISGSYIGEMGGGSCCIAIEGEVICQETPDDENGFQVIPGSQLNLQAGDKGITVRHFSEERIIG